MFKKKQVEIVEDDRYEEDYIDESYLLDDYDEVANNDYELAEDDQTVFRTVQNQTERFVERVNEFGETSQRIFNEEKRTKRAKYHAKIDRFLTNGIIIVGILLVAVLLIAFLG